MSKIKQLYLISIIIFYHCTDQKAPDRSKNNDSQQIVSMTSLNSELQENHYNDSTGKLFSEFYQNFKSFTSSGVIDLPPITWDRIYMDSSYLISQKYMDLFVRKNFEKFNSPLDSNRYFPDKSVILKFPGYQVCKIKHANDHKIAALLLIVCSQHEYSIYSTHLYYVLSYHWVPTGEPLGYDIVAGTSPSSTALFDAFRGKLKLEDQSIHIGNSFSFNEKKVYTKYRIQLDKDQKDPLERFPTDELLIDLSGEPMLKEGISYRKHCDDWVSYCIDLPYEIFVFSERIADLGGGQPVGEMFSSIDRQADLFILRNLTTNNDLLFKSSSLEQDFQMSKKITLETGRKITYSFLGKDFYVISGTDPKKIIFYEMTVFKQGVLISASLSYPQSQKNLYDKIAEQIRNSLEPSQS